ncbi:hypothetical protein APHAL10511_006188 [Amanita phalloides]|nr:hypothetical protein APHAL10511_006188 [Amanita phalloides]
MDTSKTAEKGQILPAQDTGTLDIIELTESEEDECGIQTLHRLAHTVTNLHSVVDLTLSQSDSEHSKPRGRTDTYALASEAGSRRILHNSNTFGSSAGTPVTMEPLYVDDESEPELQIWNDETRLLHKCRDEPKCARKSVHIKPDSLVPSPENRPPKRRSKKANSALEREKRIKYAEELFSELNNAVFKNGLPMDTKLTWNKRLLTTAGRANWRRSREGSHSTEIELSEKILDCKERIRNTLSHEMCHLATWLIDQDPKQAHGKLWKRWASKVMRKRPDIEITTRHSYEISYPYQWRCEKCSEIYGRFSKSIHPDECVCGVCKEGKLVPLFTVRKKTQDGSTSTKPKTPPSKTVSSSIDTKLDSESEVEVLLTALRNVTLQ